MLPILLALAFMALILIIVIAGQPDEFVITRSANLAAPPDEVFAQVNDLHQWEAWSPWATLDPNVKNTYSGAEAGPGAAMAWAGNSKVGAGRMTITASQPAERITLRLDFQKPMKSTHTVEFTFRIEGGKTVVTWKMAGKSCFMSKVFGLFMSFDKMCGGQFEKGLASLGSVTEK